MTSLVVCRGGWSAEKVAWAEQHLKSVDDLVELMEATIEGEGGGRQEDEEGVCLVAVDELSSGLVDGLVAGFRGSGEMKTALLDGPHVGVGVSMGQLRVDRTYLFEVQCARVRPGRRDLIFTGNLSEARWVDWSRSQAGSSRRRQPVSQSGKQAGREGGNFNVWLV